ncbi:HK97 family phage prohead protease [Maritalea porphyrae]|uniref:HK97 family phage prohead protease n=1 Tax=Maritalea porphyrae TaxID=880732 RepID=UPI0022AFB40F|nr:HK97 family phage prohead protease [Maritalea porphyrae]MCZ4274007.1 HK97 family phage prohead protease [Maritalea porphyrae]
MNLQDIKFLWHFGKAGQEAVQSALNAEREMLEIAMLTGRKPSPKDPIVIGGYAAWYGTSDVNGDEFAPNSLQPVRNVRMLMEHVPNSLDGYWQVEQRQNGLFVSAEINRDLLKRLVIQDIAGLSVGFRTLSAKKVNGKRVITLVQLWEVSFVLFPMQNTRWRWLP